MLKSIDANEVNLNRIVSNSSSVFRLLRVGFRIRLLGLGFFLGPAADLAESDGILENFWAIVPLNQFQCFLCRFRVVEGVSHYQTSAWPVERTFEGPGQLEQTDFKRWAIEVIRIQPTRTWEKPHRLSIGSYFLFA